MCGIARGTGPNISRQQHDSCQPQWCRIFKQKERMQPRRRPPNDDGTILNITQVIKTVMSSASKADLGILYVNVREAIYIQKILEAMGQPQPKMPLQTENSTAEEVVNKNVHPKRTKAMYTQFHWLHDCEAQQQFCFFLVQWKENESWLLVKDTASHRVSPHNEKQNIYTHQETNRIRKKKVG